MSQIFAYTEPLGGRQWDAEESVLMADFRIKLARDLHVKDLILISKEPTTVVQIQRFD